MECPKCQSTEFTLRLPYNYIQQVDVEEGKVIGWADPFCAPHFLDPSQAWWARCLHCDHDWEIVDKDRQEARRLVKSSPDPSACRM